MGLSLQPVQVDTNTADEDGHLVFRGNKLVAVLVRLSEQHGSIAGQWFLEHGFNGLDRPYHPSFPNLDAAQNWIARHLGSDTVGRV